MRINDDFNPGTQLVQCPYCDPAADEALRIHVKRVEVFPIQGAYRCEIDDSGIQIKTTDAAQNQMGISVQIGFYCEYGHIWKTEFSFHQGYTRIRDDRDLTTTSWGPDIWRRW